MASKPEKQDTDLPKSKVEELFLVDWWLKSIELLQKTEPRTFEELEDYADKEWISSIADEFEPGADAFETLKNYITFLSGKGIITAADFKVEKKGPKIILRISADYPYIIRRGRLYTSVIEIATKKFFDFKTQTEGNQTIIEITPGVFKLKVMLSPRTRRGSMKVSDKDLTKLGMDMIQDVIVLPVGKDTGMHEMMFADSKVSPGFAILGTGDASTLGVKDGDKVTLQISSTDESAAETQKTTPAAGSEPKAPEAAATEPETPKPSPPAKKDVPVKVDVKKDVPAKVGVKKDVAVKVGVKKDVAVKVGVKKDVAVKVGVKKDVPVKVGVKKDVPVKVGVKKDVPAKVEQEPKEINNKPPDAKKKAKMEDFEAKIDALRNQHE
jgi:hypothetical protein